MPATPHQLHTLSHWLQAHPTATGTAYPYGTRRPDITPTSAPASKWAVEQSGLLTINTRRLVIGIDAAEARLTDSGIDILDTHGDVVFRAAD